MRNLVLSALAAAAGASAFAQCPPPPPASFGLHRGETVVSNPTRGIPPHYASTSMSRDWQVAAPREPLASGGPGMVHTHNVAYAAYYDYDAAGNIVIGFRRSIDGGRNWQAQQNLYTFLPGETFDSSSPPMLIATNHSVFVVGCYGAITARTSGHKIYIFGSDDQGQNWDGPVHVNPDDPTLPEVFYDVDEMWAAGSGGLCHIVWENDYLVQTSEDGFYASYSMSNGTLQVGVPRMRITPGTADIDTIRVAADRSVVSIVWRDDSAGANDYYVVTSSAAGFDFPTGLPIVNLTNFVGVNTGLDAPRNAVAGGNVYVAGGDNRNGVGDEVWLYYSNDAGMTFTPVQISAGFDADTVELAAGGPGDSTVCVAWMEERNNMGSVTNSANDIFAKTDRAAGAGLTAGVVPEIQLNTLEPPSTGPGGGGVPPAIGYDATMFGVTMVEDTIVAVWEEDWHNTTTRWGEDVVIGFSADGGATWAPPRYVSGVGSAFNPPVTCGGQVNSFDIDDPFVAMTGNRDILVTWADDSQLGGGQINNSVVVSGLRLPEVQDLTAQSQGLLVNLADTRFRNQPVAVLLSLTGFSQQLDMSGDGRVILRLDFDVLTGIGLAIPQAFIAVVGANGQASLPLIPNLATQIGLPVFYTPIGFDLNAGVWSFTGDGYRF